MGIQIKNKFIKDDAVDGSKLKLSNSEALRARNAANTADVDLLRLNNGDELTFLTAPFHGGSQLVNQAFVSSGLANKIDNSEKGAANGVATLDGLGKVPSAQLPSYVDDVLEVANYAALPVTGSAGIIYVTVDNSKAFRWSGSTYIEISPSEVVSVNGQTGVVSLNTNNIGEGANLYFTDARARTAAVLNSLDAGVTAYAPSQDAVVSALAGKAAAVHTHAISDVTGLQTALDSKAADTVVLKKDGSVALEGNLIPDVNETRNLGELANRYNEAFVNQITTSTLVGHNGNAISTPALYLNDNPIAAVADPTNPQDAATKAYVDAQISSIQAYQWINVKYTLTSTHITNQYIDLADEAIDGSLMLIIDGLVAWEVDEYTLSLVAGKTRLTFAGDLAQPTGASKLEAGDIVRIRYQRISV